MWPWQLLHNAPRYADPGGRHWDRNSPLGWANNCPCVVGFFPRCNLFLEKGPCFYGNKTFNWDESEDNSSVHTQHETICFPSVSDFCTNFSESPLVQSLRFGNTSECASESCHGSWDPSPHVGHPGFGGHLGHCSFWGDSEESFTLGADGVIFLDVNFAFDAVSAFLTSTWQSLSTRNESLSGFHIGFCGRQRQQNFDVDVKI